MFDNFFGRTVNLAMVRDVEPVAPGPGGMPRCRLFFDNDHAVIVDAQLSEPV